MKVLNILLALVLCIVLLVLNLLSSGRQIIAETVMAVLFLFTVWVIVAVYQNRKNLKNSKGLLFCGLVVLALDVAFVARSLITWREYERSITEGETETRQILSNMNAGRRLLEK